jgi:integrase/recombinase XerD
VEGIVSFQKFLQERRYISNVTDRTIEWHEQSLKWLGIENPTAEDLKVCVIRMRQAGLKASSVNNRLRSIQAYLHWSSCAESKCNAGCTHLRVPHLQEERRTLPTFSADDIKKFCKWKPRTIYEHRLQVVVLTMADTGIRVSEALGLKWSDVNYNDLLLTVHGKGRLDRTIPFSVELRRFFVRYEQRLQFKSDLVFATRDGQPVERRTVNRGLHRLCRDLDIEEPARIVHALRHSFAIGSLRAGASTMHVMRMLGHSNVSQTQKYCNLVVADLQAVHRKVSLLAA